MVRARRLLGRSPPLPRWGARPKVRSPYYLQVKSTAPPQTYSALIKILKKEQWLPGCCSMCWPPGPRQNFMGEGVGHEVFVCYVLWMQGLFLEPKSSQERAASIRCPAVQQKVCGPKKRTISNTKIGFKTPFLPRVFGLPTDPAWHGDLPPLFLGCAGHSRWVCRFCGPKNGAVF